jgi:hypothetical protein
VGTYVYSLSDPAEFFEAITPSDTVNFRPGPTACSKSTRGIYVGVAGNVTAVREDGTAVTFVNVNAGTIIPIRAIRVNATNTTATNLVRLS